VRGGEIVYTLIVTVLGRDTNARRIGNIRKSPSRESRWKITTLYTTNIFISGKRTHEMKEALL